jgi:glyoxylase I family protein
MPAVAIVAANHVSFTVSDVLRTAVFFEEAFGLVRLSIGPRDPNAIRIVTGVAEADILVAYLQAPNIRIELVQYVLPKERAVYRPRPCDLGFSHLAFDVAQFETVIAQAAKYGALPVGGIATIDRGPNRGCQVVYLRDPDGITIELMGRLSGKPDSPAVR